MLHTKALQLWEEYTEQKLPSSIYKSYNFNTSIQDLELSVI